MEKGNFWVIILLTFVSFAIGVSEFAPVAILSDMARDFNRPIYNMGEITSLYALGAAIGAPIFIYFISHFNRNKQLNIALLVFAIFNFAIAMSTLYSVLVISRFFSGIIHGVYVTVAILLVTSITSEKNKPLSGTLVVSGITFAVVIGIPLVSLVGKFLSWHYVFIGITVIVLLSMIASWFVIPQTPRGEKPKLIEQFSIFKTIPLLKSYLVNIFALSGIFNFVVYMSRTLEYYNLTITETSIAFFCYGLACVIGNISGGKLAVKIGALKALMVVICGSFIFFLLFFFIPSNPIFICINLFFMGLCAFGGVGPAQSLVINNATAYVPRAIDSAFSLHVSTIQIGIATGALTGALTIANFGILYTALTSSMLFFTAFLIVLNIKEAKITKNIKPMEFSGH